MGDGVENRRMASKQRLVDGCKDGSLANALAEVKGSVAGGAKAEELANSPKNNTCAARRDLKTSLIRGCRDGSLDVALAKTRSAGDPSKPRLPDGCKDGSLAHTLTDTVSAEQTLRIHPGSKIDSGKNTPGSSNTEDDVRGIRAIDNLIAAGRSAGTTPGAVGPEGSQNMASSVEQAAVIS